MSSEGPSDQLTLWPGVSPVSLIQSPEPVEGSKTNDTSGRSSSGLSASYDLLGLSLRTCLVSVLPQLMKSSATWRRAATPSGRLWWVLAISGLPTSDDECSSSLEWPTATAQPYGMSNNGCPGDGREEYATKGKPSLKGMARWTTPQAQDAKQDTGPPSSQDRDLLASEVRRWPTARAEDSECAGAHVERGTAETLTAAARMEWETPQTGGRKSRKAMTASTDNGRRSGGGNSSTPGLEQQAELAAGQFPPEMEGIPLAPKAQAWARMWPTATAGDGKSSGSRAGTPRASEEATAHPGTSLTDAVTGQWATPSSQDAKNDTFPKSQEERKGGTLPSQFMQLGLHRPASPSTSGKSRDWPTVRAGNDALVGGSGNLAQLRGTELSKGSGNRGCLNPRWVLQLMGFPKAWLDSVPPIAVRRSRRSATRSSRK